MAEGTIKRLTTKGFGFIENGTGTDMFFHSSNLDGVSYDDLQEGQRVSYDVGGRPEGTSRRKRAGDLRTTRRADEFPSRKIEH